MLESDSESDAAEEEQARVASMAEDDPTAEPLATADPMQQPKESILAEVESEVQRSACLTAEVDSTLAELSASVDTQFAAEPETAPGGNADSSVCASEAAQSARITADVDRTLTELSSAAVAESAVQADAGPPSGGAEPEEPQGITTVHLTADIDDTLADFSRSAVSHAVSQPQPAESPVPMAFEYWLAVGLHLPTADSSPDQTGHLAEGATATLAAASASAVGDNAQLQLEAQSFEYWLAVGLHMPQAQSETDQAGRVSQDATRAELPSTPGDEDWSNTAAINLPDDEAHVMARQESDEDLEAQLSEPAATPAARITDDVDETVADLAASAVTHRAELSHPADAAATSSSGDCAAVAAAASVTVTATEALDSQVARATSDVDDALADLTSSAVDEEEHDEGLHSKEPSKHGEVVSIQSITAHTDMASPEPASFAADYTAEQQQPNTAAEMPAVEPARLTADVDDMLLELSSAVVTHVATAQSHQYIVQEAAQPELLAAGIDDSFDVMFTAAASHAAETQQVGKDETVQPVRLTADVNEMLDELSASAVSHAAQQQQHVAALAPSSEAAIGEAAKADANADMLLDDTYEADSFDAEQSAPTPEAAGAAAHVDVPLEDFYEADDFEAAEEGDNAAAMAAAAETEAAMPERPASPVAMQLAMISPAADTTAADMPSDRSAPASLAGDHIFAEQMTAGVCSRPCLPFFV